MDNCQPPLSFAFFEAAQSPLCPHFLPEGQLGYEKSQRASSPLGHPGGRFRMQEEELEMKEKEERGKDGGGRRELPFCPLSAFHSWHLGEFSALEGDSAALHSWKQR